MRLLPQFLHSEAIHKIGSGALRITRFMAVLETSMEFKHCAIFSQAIHLDPFDSFPAVEGMLYVAPFLLGDPVQPAESNGELVGPVALCWYDADLIWLEEHGSVHLVAC